VELGASIFVDVNKNMRRAVDEFNLSVYGFGDDNGEMAIWDGEQFLLTVRLLVIYCSVILTFFKDGGRGVLELLARQHQIFLEVWLLVTNDGEEAVGHSNFCLVTVLIYVTVSRP
jgi:hypothetical protein